MNTPAIRSVVLRGATGVIRTATHEGQDFVVVPVTMLVEGVIRALNSKSPELVLAEEFSIAPTGWNGRPLMMNHPMSLDGRPISANSPDVLAAACIGTIFNTMVDGKTLKSEAWINVAKVAAIGGEAQATLDRVLAGESVEVSVGVFTLAEEAQGTHNGKPYKTIWRNIVPDHLALLKAGDTGACSNAMGCGTQRAAIHVLTAEGFTEVEPMAEPATPRSLRERLKGLLPGMTAAVKGFSQSDVRDELREALKKIEPLYRYMEDVWESDGYVVYCVCEAMPGQSLTFDPYGYPNDPYATRMYRRDFTMAKDGTVTFADTRSEVELVSRFEPVVAEGQRAACACGGHTPPTTAAATTQPSEGDTMDKKTRIAALMASKHSPVKEEAALNALSDEGLKGLETLVKSAEDAETAAAATPAKTTTEPTAAAAAPAAVAPTREQILAALPADMRSALERAEKAEQTRKTDLVTALSGAQKRHTEAALKAMSLVQLEDIAALLDLEAPAAPVDYSAARPRAAAEGGEVEPPPDGYRMALDARAGKVTK